MDGTHTVIAKPTFYPQQMFYHKSESSFGGKKEGKIETSSTPTQHPTPISPGEQLAHWLSSPLPHVALEEQVGCGMSKTETWWPPC